MDFPIPATGVANAPAIPEVERVTVSPLTTPLREAEFVTRWLVASVFPSYVLLVAVMPVTVSDFDVMLAVVVGWVSV